MIAFKHKIMSKRTVARIKKAEAALAKRLKAEGPERKHVYSLPTVRPASR